MDPSKLKPLISQYLEIDDTDGTISQFISLLLSQSQTLAGFQKVAAENGADEFPDEFITRCYELYRPSGPLSLPNDKPILADLSHCKPFGAGAPELEIQKGNIVGGTVSNITQYGAFVTLPGNLSGLVHVSQLSHRRVSLPSVVVKPGQAVLVKILETIPKIKLLMKDIDQVTGIEEIFDRGRQASVPEKRRRLASPERWEIRQLIKAGMAKASDYPELNDIGQENGTGRQPEVEVDVHRSEQPPSFLKGQIVNTASDLPEIKKQPVGTLGRVALEGSKFAQEYREQHKHDKTSDVITEWRNQQKKAHYDKRPREKSLEEVRKLLPVYQMRKQIVDTIRDNQFVVVVGETGSGKTTQIVQYLYEEGIDAGKLIGCTQPRRVAAESVAKRVAEEMGVSLGGKVGYLVRFDDSTSSSTVIKYMTDGMLQREALSDADMSRYSVIMLDEAHERTVATDVLFALLKQAAAKNPNLKVICTSATLDLAKFSSYFGGCPVLTIPGRTYPVEVMYTQQPELDYVEAVLDLVMQIHMSEPLNGDILVFLTGQEEIDMCCLALFERIKVLGDTIPDLLVLPMYSALPPEMQQRVFDPAPKGTRKVVIATNIAETSITIDRINYVVDPGLVKLNAYDARLGMDTLRVVPISQAQANQRSGRAGRTGPGKCFRLYTEKAFTKEMAVSTSPEIKRQNLSHTILMLKAMGINDLLGFDFMDPPAALAMVSALNDLFILGALDDNGYLTDLGRKMAEFPMEPMLAKTLIVLAQDPYNCSQEIMLIVAMLLIQNVWYRPKDKATEADRRKARFHHLQLDHLTLLNVYRGWELNHRSSQWCKDNYIQERSMKRALEVRKQLATIMHRSHQQIVLCGLDVDAVRKALVAGFFKNLAKRDRIEGYKTISLDTPVLIHPLSCLFGKRPEYLVYHSLLLTTKEYMQTSTEIKPQWLKEAAPHYFGITDAKALVALRKGEKLGLLGRKGEWRLGDKYKSKAKKMSEIE